MRWQDLEQDCWTLPSETTKNKRKHMIFICPLARQEIDNVKLITAGREFVFWGAGNQPLKALRHLVGQLLEIIHKQGKPIERFCLRDIRRTVQTQMAASGIRPDIVDRVLNHNIPGVRAHYDLYSYFPEVKAALLTWDKVLFQSLTNFSHYQLSKEGETLIR